MSRQLIVIPFTIIFLFGALLSATTVIELDLKGLVQASDLIVIGKVKSTRVFMKNKRILTSIIIDKERILKGGTGSTDSIEIVQYGGRMNKLTTYVPGMPQFVEKEKVLLFLEKQKNMTSYVVTGLSQGKFNLAKGPDGINTFVVPTSLGGMTLLPQKNKSVDNTSLEGPNIKRVVLSLDSFSQKIIELQK